MSSSSSDSDCDEKERNSQGDRNTLCTKHYCQVNNGKVKSFGDPSVDIVTEIWATNKSMTKHIPLRYILVIDVSSSMGVEIGHGPDSLLDRVKIFAELVIDEISEEDSLAIVTFSDEAEVELEMTVMSEDEKELARNVVQYLHTKQNTNLESGLMAGLDVIAKNPSPHSRDCIILFTDGETNTGEQDVEALVKNYKERQDNMGRKTCVPVSAFTIGQYLPVLLAELADFLGSEAFYWLNEEEDFESDMLLPIFLRETTAISDITIQMKCLLDFTFDADSLSRKHLQSSSLSELEYFVHSIPGGVKKHISFTIIPPERSLKNFRKERIVEIKVSFTDGSLKKRELNGFVLFSALNLRKCRARGKREKGVRYSDITDGIAAYTIENNIVDSSWIAAQEALEMIVREDCRELSMNELDNVLYHILEEEDHLTVNSFEQAISSILDIKTTYRTVIFGHKNQCTARIDACADDWIERLNFGKSIANPYNYGRIAALQSSIATEMPVAKGVYHMEQKQLYMPKNIQKRLREYERIVKKFKRLEDFGTSKVFEGKTILISETLRTQKIGAKRESYAEIVIRCGGRPEYFVIVNPYKKRPGWYVEKNYDDFFLVCCKKDYKKNSMSVRDSRKVQIPIVRKEFLFECIRRKKFLNMESYFYNFP
uniref:uncharacterized protein LOC120346390 n=1 Tax=Styela clava TaxID=7725 RepID=UPI00193985D0|nr:uncharacterized protein LOC120346390 [Styela clava]